MANSPETEKGQNPFAFLEDSLAKSRERFGGKLGTYLFLYLLNISVDGPKEKLEGHRENFAEEIATAMEGTHEQRVNAVKSLLSVFEYVAGTVRVVDREARRKIFIDELQKAGLG